MPTKESHLSPSSLRNESFVTANADLQYTLKRIQGEELRTRLCALGKLAENAFRYF